MKQISHFLLTSPKNHVRIVVRRREKAIKIKQKYQYIGKGVGKVKQKFQTGILVISHGSLAAGLLESLRMICGEVPGVSALTYFEGEDTRGFAESLRRALQEYGPDVLVFADLFGGTPFNQLVTSCRDLPCSIITGVNLPTLIEAVSLREQFHGEALVREILTAAGVNPADGRAMLEQNQEQNQEESLPELE